MPAIWAGDSISGRLSTTGVERSEVYRGPNSSLYGADAESGVVNIDDAARNYELSVAAVSWRLGKFRELARGSDGGGNIREARLSGRV